MNETLLIVGMAGVTLAVRYPVLALVGRLPLPEPVFRALRFVPPAVLAAIIVPGVLFKDNQLWLSPANNYLAAGIVSVLVAWRTRNLLLTIILGMLVLLIWRWVVAQVVG